MVRISKSLTTETVLVVTVVGIITVLGWLWYQKRQKHAVPTVWKPVGIIKNLFIYPLKSGHRIELKTAVCSEYGIKMPKSGSSYQFCDRNLLVYREEDNEFRTARQYPKMIFIKVVPFGENHFTLNAPDMSTLKVKIPSSDKHDKDDEITLHKGEKIFTTDCGDDVARWISNYILGSDSGLRLGFHDGLRRRNITQTHKKYLDIYSRLGNEATGMYTDLSSFLIMNQASVDELSSRIPTANISANNFRPNILIEGENTGPYAEDNWEWVKIGDVVLYMARYCTRCVFTTINPETGVKSETNEPLRTMRTYRLLKDIKNIDLDGNLPVMGVNMGLQIGGEISVGDVVYVGRN